MQNRPTDWCSIAVSFYISCLYTYAFHFLYTRYIFLVRVQMLDDHWHGRGFVVGKLEVQRNVKGASERGTLWIILDSGTNIPKDHKSIDV